MTRPSPLMAIVVLLATAAFIASPLLTGGFRGYDPTQFPVPQVDPLIQPPGWTFGIWAVIYVWLGVSAGYGVVMRMTEPDWAPMRPTMALATAVGATWLPVAQVSPFLATVLIFVMAVSAIVALHDAPFLDHWWARAPAGLFAGWLTAASFVSLGLVLAGYGLFSDRGAAILCLLLALAVAAFVIWTVRDTAMYEAAIAWALAGIFLSSLPHDRMVSALSGLGAVVIGLMALRSTQRILAQTK
ncbi:hypothetical protein [Marinibacterium profundimaris]|uniref:Uncharacterized protein n=1 Tax=Marinibacterium profundimaris TaxID=1679460 RepID=A0A225NQK1_9RHOB|nr:hypothetical protein [Marinibacterium profundimaris]OWU77241.1 hypothetical protein ATO3_00405 [Marinibacterium profundimaris]